MIYPLPATLAETYHTHSPQTAAPEASGSFIYETVVEQNELMKRVGQIAMSTIERHDNPLFVCILRGGAPLSAILMREIVSLDKHLQPELDYIRLHTPGIDRERVHQEVMWPLERSKIDKGRHVILLDGLLDTGLTAEVARSHVLDVLGGRTEVELISAVEKSGKNNYFPEDQVHACFSLPPEQWYAGFGLEVPDGNKTESFRHFQRIVKIIDSAA